MGTVLTLIGDPVKAGSGETVLDQGTIDLVRRAVEAAGHATGTVTALHDGVAVDIAAEGEAVAVRDAIVGHPSISRRRAPCRVASAPGLFCVSPPCL